MQGSKAAYWGMVPKRDVAHADQEIDGVETDGVETHGVETDGVVDLSEVAIRSMVLTTGEVLLYASQRVLPMNLVLFLKVELVTQTIPFLSFL